MSSFEQHPIDLRRVRTALDTAARRTLGVAIADGSLVAAACSKPVPPQPPTEVTVAPVADVTGSANTSQVPDEFCLYSTL